MRWASSHDLEALKLDAAALRELASANTHAGMQPLMGVAPPASKGKIGAIDTADAYTASRLAVRVRLGAARQGPGRRADRRGAAADDDPVHRRRQPGRGSPRCARSRASGGRAPDALGDKLLRWTPDGWKPLP